MSRFFVQDKQFYKTTVILAAPVVLQNMITIMVNMLDTIMLGKYGEIQLSGSSLANSFVGIYQILCMGIGGGAAVLTAQYWGSNNQDAVRKITVLMIRISMIFAMIFFLMSISIPETIMHWYTSDPVVIQAGVIYLRIVSPTFILAGLSQTLIIVLRSVREVKLPLIISIVSFFTNLFFNWVLIFGKLGLPELQIRGAAWATVIARAIETVILLYYLFCKDKKIGLRVHHLTEPCREYLSRYVHYSAPVILSDFLLGLGNSMVSMIIGHMSASFVAANSIVSMTVRLSTVMNQGFANSGSIMTGNTLGEGDAEKAHQQGFTFLWLSVLLGLFASGLILLLSPTIIGAYNITEETREIAFRLMESVAIMVVFQGTQSMLTKGVLRGGGDTQFLVAADISFMWLLSIPLGYLSAFVWHMSPFWIYLFMKIDYIVKTIWCTFRLRGNKWIKKLALAEPLQAKDT
ncbi:MAG: MATE family efflux transporter [Clostridia bacterium]|nr:MATE family efflux transporter [Clostridia bacterium]